MEPLLVGPDGKEVKSQKYAACPQCGRPPESRVRSGGFGEVYWICVCGYEFNKELKCEPIIP